MTTSTTPHMEQTEQHELQQKVWALEKRCSRLKHALREKDGIIRHLQSAAAKDIAAAVSRILQGQGNDDKAKQQHR
ncbi:MAG: hypothetical protein HGA87_05340 [Desulfobulbaceae bacterium]|nr:hypothetical protein [Desulfobulbaceae bacterium]